MIFVVFAKIRRRVTFILIRTYQLFRVVLFKLLSSCRLDGDPVRLQPLLASGLGRISFTGRVVIGYYPSPGFLSSYAHIEARGAQAEITIEDGTKINNNFCAVAEHTTIKIGKNCLIGTNVEILDSDFHGLEVSERNQSKPEWARAVQVMDNVFIGSNAKIMKGVTIGEGALVANSAVVTKDVPAFSIVAGNPASVIKMLADNPGE
jgi:acetyltransferase-like isoleucine patch superfamily enzyme